MHRPAAPAISKASIGPSHPRSSLALSLGIDTGGTYTDAVLYDPARGVLAAAKALTTRHDLAEGVGAAIAGVLPDGAA